MARPSKALLWAGAAGLALVAAWAWRHFDLGAPVPAAWFLPLLPRP